MATNYVQPGEILTLTAPTGGVTSGTPVFVNGLFVIPMSTVAQTLPFQGSVMGVHSLTKTDSQAWIEGQSIYWDLANSCATAVVTAGPLIGYATAAVAVTAGLTTGLVALCCKPAAAGGIFNVRKRCTVAEVNAGVTVLPARAGLKYRMVDAFAIAIGGAATTGTTVDILGTISSARKLVAFGQAALTQSTLVRAGGTGGTILADGASFTTNDANTAITVLKTGSDFTVATHVDVSLTYAIEA